MPSLKYLDKVNNPCFSSSLESARYEYSPFVTCNDVELPASFLEVTDDAMHGTATHDSGLRAQLLQLLTQQETAFDALLSLSRSYVVHYGIAHYDPTRIFLLLRSNAHTYARTSTATWPRPTTLSSFCNRRPYSVLINCNYDFSQQNCFQCLCLHCPVTHAHIRSSFPSSEAFSLVQQRCVGDGVSGGPCFVNCAPAWVHEMWVQIPTARFTYI